MNDKYLSSGKRPRDGGGPPLSAELAPAVTSHGLKVRTRVTRARAVDRPDSLNKRELQLFTKRLNENVRREFGRGVKYYACGEYGDEDQRPHYHVALFGEDFSDDRYKWRRSKTGHQLWRSSRLERLWPHGHAEIGDLTFESAAYVARYIMKKVNGQKADDHYKRTDPETGEIYWIQPEFNVMSRGGRTGKGLGHAWLLENKNDVYGAGDYVVVRGKKCKPPRYYDKILQALAPFEHEAITQAREMTRTTDPADETPERLAVREAVALARLKQHKRQLE